MDKVYQVNQWLWNHLKWGHGVLKGPNVMKPKPWCETCQRLGMDW